MSIYVATPQDTFVSSVATGSHIRRYPTPAGAMGDIRWWLESPMFPNHRTIVLPVWAGEREALRTVITELGWATQPTAGAWFTCRRRRPDQRWDVRHLCIRDWVSRDDPVIPYRATAEDVAIALHQWLEVMRAPYRHTPGVAAHDSIRMHHLKRPPQWAPYRPRTVLGGWTGPDAHIRPILWNITDPAGPSWEKFDTRNAYLAAMRAVMLPNGPLEATGVEPNGPGYLAVRANDSYHPLWTFLRDCWNVNESLKIIGTATAEVLRSAGAQFETIDSWTAPGARLLRSWAERLDKLPNHLRKATYTQAHGLLNTKTGAIQRPDWYDLIIDQANATLLRRIWRAGQYGYWPTRIQVDAVTYPSPADSAGWNLLRDALVVGDHVGQMRYEGREV